MSRLSRSALRRLADVMVHPEPVGCDQADEEARVAARDPTNMVGRFVLLSEAGQGAMGQVYRAYDPQLKRVVALKLIGTPSLDDATVRGKQREFVAMARLRHPGIVPIFDGGVEGDRLYYAMEWMDGGSLQEKIRTGPLEPSLAAAWIAEIADALACAHREGFLHLDVKPSNILLQGSHPKLADFGCTRPLLPSSEAEAGTARGTPGYMAPELQLGPLSDVDQRTDIFAAGATLHTLLTGRPPDHTGLSEQIDAGLRTIIRRAMDPDKQSRYRHAGELAAALRGWSPARTSRRALVLAGLATLLVIFAVWTTGLFDSDAGDAGGHLLANRLLEQLDYAGAQQLYDQLLEQDPVDTRAHEGILRAIIGIWLETFSFHPVRSHELEQLHEREDFDDSVLLLAREGHEFAAQLKAVRNDFDRAMHLDVNELPYELALLYVLIQLEHTSDRVDADLAVVRRKWPDRDAARLLHAWVKFDRRPGMALTILGTLQHPAAIHLRGLCRLVEGNLDQAEDLLRQASALQPQALADLGLALTLSGAYAKAVTSYQECLKRLPGNYTALYHLALVRHKQGRDDPAMELLAVAVELANQDPEGWDENDNLVDFDVQTRSSGSFQQLSRAFLQRDPELAGLRERADFAQRIGALIP